ncbi:hypothetical protein ACFPYJ_25855 [Paenibacillus solisilvae]|uniref:Uncharacterized protein n=1 Tax=Paenibacillus solisilvae TaxID=2486751 RepID=A0ABW0W815_9BACL
MIHYYAEEKLYYYREQELQRLAKEHWKYTAYRHEGKIEVIHWAISTLM